MYLVLIEAGGLRQLARIYDDWYHRFLRNLDEVMARHGFVRRRIDGDLLFFDQTDRHPETDTAPSLPVEAMRAVHTYLRGGGDTLLDFLVILEHERSGDAARGFRNLENSVAGAREPNSIYVTSRAYGGLEPFLETQRCRNLHRVVAFRSDEHDSGQLLREFLTSHPGVTSLREVLAGTGSDKPLLWVWGADRAVVTSTVQSALEQDGVLPVTIQCRPGMSRADFERALVLELPDLPPLTRSGPELEFEQTITVLRQRLKNGGTVYLSTGWVDDDLHLVAAHLLERFLQSGSRRGLFIADFDCLDISFSEFMQMVPETTSAGPIVFSGIVARDDIPCTAVSIPAVPGTVLRYWCGSDRECTLQDAAGILQQELTDTDRKALFLIVASLGMADNPGMDPPSVILDLTPAERSRIVGSLYRIGLLANVEPLSIQPVTLDLLEYLLSREERKSLLRGLAEFVLRKTDEGMLRTTPLHWTFVRNYAPEEEKERYYHRMIHDLSAGGDRRGLSQVMPANQDGTIRQELSIGERSARIRLAVREASITETIEEDASILREEIRRHESREEYALSLAEYHLACREYDEALRLCKRVVLMGQDTSDARRSTPGGGAGGQLLIARIAILQRRLREATQYLGFAREDGAHDPVILLTSRMLDATCIFLFGNLTLAMERLEALQEDLLNTGFTEWLLFNWFLRGRIQFDLGEYGEARSRFSLVDRYAAGSGRTDIVRTAAAWRARSDLHRDLDDPVAWEQLAGHDSCSETLLFLGEALCRKGEFAAALAPLEQACISAEKEDRRPRIGVNWDNGFASVEDLIFAREAGSSELLRIATSYRAWALAETGDMDGAVSLFFDLTRGSGDVMDDPYGGLYTYLYASILPRGRNRNMDDAKTVMAKAVKLVQERTSRIDDFRDKTRYLGSNVWNKRLMTAARTFNLV